MLNVLYGAVERTYSSPSLLLGALEISLQPPFNKYSLFYCYCSTVVVVLIHFVLSSHGPKSTIYFATIKQKHHLLCCTLDINNLD